MTARAGGRLPKVLVTGAAGFVGRRLVEGLGKAGDLFGDIVAAVRPNEPTPAGPTVHLDVTDVDSLNRALDITRPDVIVHLAAQASVGESARSANSTWRTNVQGTFNVAQIVADRVPRATVLFVSTAEVYGAAYNEGVATETTAPQPLSSYARSKLAAEFALTDVLASTNRLIVARPTNHSGFGQDERFVLPSFAAQIRNGAAEIRVGNLSPRRDFLHVEDVVDAYIQLLRYRLALPSRSVFNIGSGQTVSISDLLRSMIQLSGVSPAVVIDPARVRDADVPNAGVNVAAILRATGWRARRSLDEMLTDVLSAPRPFKSRDL